MSLKRLVADSLYKTLPRISALLASIWGYFWRPNKSYALYGEDLVVINLFNEFNSGFKTGVYVDIGAFHPRWISNTHALSKLGWRGVVVDLDRNKLFAFDLLRRRCKSKWGAVVPKSFSSKNVKVFAFQRMCSEWDTLSESDAIAMSEKYDVPYEEKVAPALRINELLAETVETFLSEVDFLNIDIEGMDDEVLQDLDLRQYGVKVLQFENNKYFGGTNSLKKNLISSGYTHVATNGGTHTWACNEMLSSRFLNT